MRAQTFAQLSERLLSRNLQQPIIIKSGIDTNTFKSKPKTLEELSATHHVPGKFRKYFENNSNDARNPNNARNPVIRKRSVVGVVQPEQEKLDTAKSSKKHSKINDIIFNILEESAHLSNAIKKDKWKITRIQHTTTKAIIYYEIIENTAQENQKNEIEKADLIELISHFEPAVQKAFNSQFLKFNKWSAKRKDMPKILLKYDEYLSRAEHLNSLLDKVELELNL